MKKSMAAKAASGLSVVRTAVLGLVGLIVAWTSLSSSVNSFKKAQLSARKRDAKTIVAIQKYRTPFLDRVLTAWTFLGEEEFYLLSLPWLFWNIDHALGTQMTFVVTIGIFGGNFLKDMFGIPRPPSPPVWVCPELHSSDSTALRDFGFPSTHSLNALSNPLFLVMHYYSLGHLSTDAPLPLLAAVLAGVAYCTILAGSRMYLGVHSPNDVKAGLFMGLLLCSIHGSWGQAAYTWITTSPTAPLACVGICVLLLLMCPQPYPRTPTFMQQCTLAGLMLGNVLGTRLSYDRVWYDSAAAMAASAGLTVAPGTGAAYGMGGAVARFLSGAVAVMLVRVLAKLVINTVLQSVGGVKLFQKPKDDAGFRAQAETKTVVLEALSKTLVYTMLAVGVTYGAPIMHNATGLSALSF